MLRGRTKQKGSTVERTTNHNVRNTSRGYITGRRQTQTGTRNQKPNSLQRDATCLKTGCPTDKRAHHLECAHARVHRGTLQRIAEARGHQPPATRPQKKPGLTKNGRSRVLHHLYGYVGRQHGTSRHLLPAKKLAQTHSGDKTKTQDNQLFAAETPHVPGRGQAFFSKKLGRG